MFIKPIRLDSTNKQKQTFKSAGGSMEELARLFVKKQSGKISELEKSFSKKQIEGFFLTGFLNRQGGNWKAAPQNSKMLVDFYKNPNLMDRLRGLYCHYVLKFSPKTVIFCLYQQIRCLSAEIPV